VARLRPRTDARKSGARFADLGAQHVPAPERRRTYARPSRRQASAPDIPRPGWHTPEEEIRRCTFGVVVDTSGSMNHDLMGKALGAIASYATARDVPAARVVFCDAAAYDARFRRSSCPSASPAPYSRTS